MRFVGGALAVASFVALACAKASALGCTLTTPTTISVGTYDPTILSASRNATFAISYACDLGTVATNLSISANLGNNATGATFDTRAMRAAGSDRLDYWLYPPGFAVTQHSPSNVWGDGTGASKVWGPFAIGVGQLTGNGTGAIQVESNQDVAGGSYSDTVTFTMTFV